MSEEESKLTIEELAYEYKDAKNRLNKCDLDRTKAIYEVLRDIEPDQIADSEISEQWKTIRNDIDHLIRCLTEKSASFY